MAAARHWNAETVRTLQHFGVGFAKRLQIGEDRRQPAGRAALNPARQRMQPDSRERNDAGGAKERRQGELHLPKVDHIRTAKVSCGARSRAPASSVAIAERASRC